MRAVLALVACSACGRIGFGDAESGDASTSATDATAACAVVDVAVGQRHTCALTARGTTYCAGDNREGQLGTGGVFDMTGTPELATELMRADRIYAGTEFTCMRDDGGLLGCVGDNGNRQTSPDSSLYTLTLTQQLAAPVSLVALGNTFGCLTSGTDVYCWGDADEGQAGNGAAPGSHAAELVPALSGKTTTVLAAGSNHVCAVSDGNVACWGDGRTFRLGATASDTCAMATEGSLTCALTPLAVPSVSFATALSGGGDHTCAIVGGTSGVVMCWGGNDYGQVGMPDSTEEAPTLVGSGTATAIATGRAHTCMLDGNGIVWCWGANQGHQLGDMRVGGPTPVAVSLPARASSIASHALARTTCARLVDGSLYCWGENEYGQLGRGTIALTGAPAPFEIPCP